MPRHLKARERVAREKSTAGQRKSVERKRKSREGRDARRFAEASAANMSVEDYLAMHARTREAQARTRTLVVSTTSRR